MQAIMGLMMNAAQYLGSPIDGPPTNVQKFYHSGSKIGFSWVNGDRDAQIEYSYDGGTSVEGSLPPGTTLLNTTFTDTTWGSNVFAVRHVDGIYSSVWVEYAP